MRLRRLPFSVRAIARVVAISETVPLRERYSRSASSAWRYASRASASPPNRSRASALIAPATPSSQCAPHSTGADRAGAPILDDLAVREVNLPLASFGNGRVMGDQQQGRAEAGVMLEQAIDDNTAGRAVEIAGGLVSQQQFRTGDERARDCHALLLTAGKLAGIMGQTMTETNRCERLCGRDEGIGPTSELERDRDIFERRHCRNQMKGLKYDADPGAAQPGKSILVQSANVGAVDHHSSRGQPFQSADDHQQRRFPRAGRADYADGFSCPDLERDAAQNVDGARCAPQC